MLVLVVYFAVVVGLGHFLGRAFGVNSYPVLVVLMAASSLAILPLRRIVQNWIDRTFYPARRANRKAMRLLADELAGLINPEDVTSHPARSPGCPVPADRSGSLPQDDGRGQRLPRL